MFGVVLAAVLAALLHRQILVFTGEHWGFCPQQVSRYDARDLEELVPDVKVAHEFDRYRHQNSILVRAPEGHAYILSRHPVISLDVRTVDAPGGLTNRVVAIVDTATPPPAGLLFRYPLKGVLEARKYCKEVGVKFTDAGIQEE